MILGHTIVPRTDKTKMSAADSILWDIAEDVIRTTPITWEKFSGARILITGSSGFLGAHLTRIFLKANESFRKPAQLTLVDSGIVPPHAEIYSSENVEFIRSDLKGQIPAGDWDYVLHAASIASPIFYLKHPIQTIEANVFALKNLLDAIVDRPIPIRSFLYFSSSEVYGTPSAQDLPLREDFVGAVDPLSPRACYAESKRMGEALCRAYHSTYNLPIKIVRPFNNYGPGMNPRDGRVIADFARNLVQNRNLEILSDGLPTRTFCYISDALRGFIQLLVSDLNLIPINIGNDQGEISVRELAEKMVAYCSSAAEIQFRSDTADAYLKKAPAARRPSIEKAKKLLGYSAQVSLEEGLRRTLKWYEEELRP